MTSSSSLSASSSFPLSSTSSPVAAARGNLKWGRIFALVALALLAAHYVRVFNYTPVEATQGLAQKIFYVHVPAAWSAFLAYFVVGICSALFLWLQDRRLDLFAEASAEVGTVLTFIVLTTGPLWGKPIWGTWWQWEVRLTSTLFLFFLFLGYMTLRKAVFDPLERARYSAVVGIMGALLVPFIHVSVYMFRTIHPKPVILKPEAPSLPGSMLSTLLMGFGIFTLLYLGLTLVRYGIGRLNEEKEARLADAA
jgi:heme exporter protein C